MLFDDRSHQMLNSGDWKQMTFKDTEKCHSILADAIEEHIGWLRCNSAYVHMAYANAHEYDSVNADRIVVALLASLVQRLLNADQRDDVLEQLKNVELNSRRPPRSN